MGVADLGAGVAAGALGLHWDANYVIVMKMKGLCSSKGQPQLVILSAVLGRRGLQVWAAGEVAAGMVGAKWRHAVEWAAGPS